MENKITYKKLALRRDASYPVGVSAPMHTVCTCGHDIKIQDATNRCTWCGLVVSANGCILEDDKGGHHHPESQNATIGEA